MDREDSVRFQFDRELALADFGAWVRQLDESERTRQSIFVGEQAFSPLDVLGKIESGDEQSRIFINTLAEIREDMILRAGLSAAEDASSAPETTNKIEDMDTLIANQMNKYQQTYNLLKMMKQKKLALRTVLVLRPNNPGNTYESGFTFPMSGELMKGIDHLEAINWTIVELAGVDCTRDRVERTIATKEPDLILHFDHGNAFAIHGVDILFDFSNVHLLKGRSLSTVSCGSARNLGVEAVSKGCRAYLGYDDDMYGYWPCDECFRCANAANLALLNGCTFGEALQFGRLTYTQAYLELIAKGDLGKAMALKSNGSRLRLVGDPNAVAYQ